MMTMAGGGLGIAHLADIEPIALGSRADLIRLGRTTGSTRSVLHGSTSTLPLTTLPPMEGRPAPPISTRGSRLVTDHDRTARVSPGAIPGTVTQQVPANGSVATLPLTVTLYIPRSSTMPAVVGRPAETVCLQLTALGLTCEQTVQFDDQVAPGAVISSDPVEGTGFNEGDTVRLQVSRGPFVNTTVPDVGRRSEEEARMILAEAGFITIATLAQPSEQVGQGMAIGTTPAAGSSVPIHEPVTILISSGPAQRVMVPDLVGSDRATAEARLGQAGLTATFLTRDLPAGDPNIGRVVAVDPGQGTEVLAGTMVAVTIGQQAASTATTAAAGTSSD